MDSTKMADENFNPDYTDFEQNVPYRNDSTSPGNPLDDLSKQLQVLNLGDSTNSNRGKFNYQTWCSPLKTSVNPNSKRLLSDITNNDSTTFQHPFSIPKKASSVVEQEEKHTSFLEKGTSESVTNICHFPYASDQFGNVARTETKTSSISQLLNSSDGWEDPFESYSGSVEQKFFDLSTRKEKMEQPECSREKATPDGSSKMDCVEKGASHIKIQTPYKKNVLVRLRNSPDDSEYTKKRDMLMKCDKLLTKDDEAEKEKSSVADNTRETTRSEDTVMQEEESPNYFEVETEIVNNLKVTREESIVCETLTDRNEIDTRCHQAKDSSPMHALFSKQSSCPVDARSAFKMSEDLFDEEPINIFWNDDDFKNIAESVQRDLEVEPVSAPIARHTERVAARTTFTAHTTMIVEEKTRSLVGKKEFEEPYQVSDDVFSTDIGPAKKNVRFASNETFDLEVSSNDESTKNLQVEDIDSDHSSDFESIHSDIDLNEDDHSIKNAFIPDCSDNESTPTIGRITRPSISFYEENSLAKSYDRRSMPHNVCLQSTILCTNGNVSELESRDEAPLVEGNVCSVTNDDSDSDCSSDFESIASDTTCVADQQNEISVGETEQVEMYRETGSEKPSSPENNLESHIESSKEEVIESTNSEIREPQPIQTESRNPSLVYVKKTRIEASSTASEFACSSENNSTRLTEVTIELNETKTRSVVDVVTEISGCGVTEIFEVTNTINVGHYSFHLGNASPECASISEQDEDTIESANRSHIIPQVNDTNEKESHAYSSVMLPKNNPEPSEQGQEENDAAEMLSKIKEYEVEEMLKNLTMSNKLERSTNDGLSEQCCQTLDVLDMFSEEINAKQTEVTSEVVKRLSLSEAGRTAMGLNKDELVHEFSSSDISTTSDFQENQKGDLNDSVESLTADQPFSKTGSHEHEEIVDVPAANKQQTEQVRENLNPILVPGNNNEIKEKITLETVEENRENLFDNCDSSFTVASSIHKSLAIIVTTSSSKSEAVEEPKPETESLSNSSQSDSCNAESTSCSIQIADSCDCTRGENELVKKISSRKNEPIENAYPLSTACSSAIQLDRPDFQIPDCSRSFEEVLSDINTPDCGLVVSDVQHSSEQQSPRISFNTNLEEIQSIAKNDIAKYHESNSELQKFPTELSTDEQRMEPECTSVHTGTLIENNISMISDLLNKSLPSCSEVAAEIYCRMAPVISMDSEYGDESPPGEGTFVFAQQIEESNSPVMETPTDNNPAEVGCSLMLEHTEKENVAALVQSSIHIFKTPSQVDAVSTPTEHTKRTPSKTEATEQLDPLCTPKTTSYQQSELQESTIAAKVRGNFNKILTPFRDNVLRLCTPRSERGSRKAETVTESPSFKCEASEDPQKMRFVLEVPTSLLDLSIAAMENMAAGVKTQESAGTTVASNFEPEAGEVAVDSRSMAVDDSEEIANLKQQLEDKILALKNLSAEHEKLKSICDALQENENILKKALDESENNNRVLCNRYEMLKDYADRFVCQINEERETLATKLELAVEELEASRKNVEKS